MASTLTSPLLSFASKDQNISRLMLIPFVVMSTKKFEPKSTAIILIRRGRRRGINFGKTRRKKRRKSTQGTRKKGGKRTSEAGEEQKVHLK